MSKTVSEPKMIVAVSYYISCLPTVQYSYSAHDSIHVFDLNLILINF